MPYPTFQTRARILASLVMFGLSACTGEFHQLDEGFADDELATGSAGFEEADQELAATPELAFVDRAGEVTEIYYAGVPLHVEIIDGEYVHEGDILLEPELVTTEPIDLVRPADEAPSEGSTEYLLAARTEDNLWPDGKVPYAIDPNLENPERVLEAIEHWEANATVDFVEHTGELNYLWFTPGQGCSSYIGRIGGQQHVRLKSTCSRGNTIHEIGHALGAWHEHTRADRSSYVKINWENIEEGYEHNFRTYEELGKDGVELTGSMDFDSIMMYGSTAFSRNGLPTIVKLDGSTFRSQRSGLSQGDIQGFAKVYDGDVGTQTEYVAGETYLISGVRVLYYRDRWYFSTKYGWKVVRLVNGYWYYV